MADKSFGDHTNRGVVKNPLLSNVVTGLSLDDLTQKAVLLPVSPTPGVIVGSESNRPTVHTLANTRHDQPVFSSGDADKTYPIFNPSNDNNSHNTKEKNLVKQHEIRDATLPKDSVKSDDDFDVNEYFARLQGTRYVSAPIHSNIIEDQSADADENLEEINLNEPDKPQMDIQQSLTADIAQNFSQLPTVLPHVASAVFSSFSNMLSLKGREQTPDSAKPVSGYQEVEPLHLESRTVPLMSVEEPVRNIGPPPKEPPIGGSGNYRITSKKKYAQIPGLTCGDTGPNIYSAPLNPNTPLSFTPTHIERDKIPVKEHTNIDKQNLTRLDPAYTIPDILPDISNFENTPNVIEKSGYINPVGAILKDTNIEGKEVTYNIFTPAEVYIQNTSNLSQSQATIKMQQDFSTNTNINESDFDGNYINPIPTHDMNAPLDSATVVPPPPMFSNTPSDKPPVGKSILPPSVARRISAKQPIIKPQSVTPMVFENIFVPILVHDTIDPHSTTEDLKETPESMQYSHQMDLLPKNNLPYQSSQFATASIPATSLFYTPASDIQPPLVQKPPASDISVCKSVKPDLNISTVNIQQSKSTSISSSVSNHDDISNIELLFASKQKIEKPLLPPSACAPDQSNFRLPLPFSSSSRLPTNKETSASAKFDLIQPPFSVPLSTSTTDANMHPPVISQPQPSIQSVLYDHSQIQRERREIEQADKAQSPIKFFDPSTLFPEASLPITEPPRSSNSFNYRMSKKKPQYYSGPISGFGSISNNVKPVMPAVGSDSFKGALFTPEPQSVDNTNMDNISMPFDISKSTQTAPVPLEDVSKFVIQPEYNASFDLSRQTSEVEIPKEESKGFGIIGSLKSKLSSIDIHKIQNSVTTFFDPAYNDIKNKTANWQEDVPFDQQNTYEQNPQNRNTNFEVFVPNVEYTSLSRAGQTLEDVSHSRHNTNENRNPFNYYQNQEQGNNLHASSYFAYSNNSITVQPTHTTTSVSFDPLSGFTYTEMCREDITKGIDKDVPKASSFVKIVSLPGIVDSNTYADDFSQNQQSRHEHGNLPQMCKDKRIDKFVPNASKFVKIVSLPGIGDFDTYADDFSKNQQSRDEHRDLPQKCNDKRIDKIVPNASSFVKIVSLPGIGDSDTYADDFRQNQQRRDEHGDLPQMSKYKEYENEPLPTSIRDFTQDVNKVSSDVSDIKLFDTSLPENKTCETSGVLRPGSSKLRTIEDFSTAQNMYSTKTNVFEPKTEIFPVPTLDIAKQDKLLKKVFDTEEKNMQVDSGNKLDSIPLFQNVLTNTIDVDPFVYIKPKHQESQLPSRNHPEIKIRETNLLESLSTDEIPIVAVSSVPLFGLSTIIPEKSKETLLSESKKPESSLPKTERPYDKKAIARFFENIPPREIIKPQEIKISKELQKVKEFKIPKREEAETEPDLNICETCREVNKHEGRETEDLTAQLIENITAPIQLSNPVEAPFTEGETTQTRVEFDRDQFEKISHITEDTIESIHMHSATELLDNVSMVKPRGRSNYVWHVDSSTSEEDNDFKCTSKPPSGVFYENNSQFFDKVLHNVIDDNKTESNVNNEGNEVNAGASTSAPIHILPAENDSRSEAAGNIDVNSIELDANRDFPVYVIEPSSSEEDSTDLREIEKFKETGIKMESFTNRIERFKKREETKIDNPEIYRTKLSSVNSPSIPIASYFDTGNYAAETHYENYLYSSSSGNYMGSPSQPMRIPPGFEDEYQRRMSGLSNSQVTSYLDSDDKSDEPVVLETSTQSSTAVTVDSKDIDDDFDVQSHLTNCIDESDIQLPPQTKPNKPLLAMMFGTRSEDEDDVDYDDTRARNGSDDMSPSEPPIMYGSVQVDFDDRHGDSEDYKRLASYFDSPTNTEHSKSFFELSQSENHYRHNSNENQTSHDNNENQIRNIDNDNYVANFNLMKDLTSVDNIQPSKDQTDKIVHYFTFEYDREIETILNERNNILYNLNYKVKLDKTKENERDENIDKLAFSFKTESNCETCSDVIKFNNNIEEILKSNAAYESDNDKFYTDVNECDICYLNINEGNYKFRKFVNDSAGSNKEINSSMAQGNEDPRRSATVNFDTYSLQDDANDGVTVLNENRTTSEYTQVKHHWFYRVDIDDKSIWRGFSVVDSNALEDAYLSENLTEETVVPTDGGRYDVYVIGRIRKPVYWDDKPTNVRRCSWFYKGTTDARYVPYSENVAEKLEEEYRHGITTGEWHRQLILPNNELVVMHGPSVMVHFLHGGAADTFSTSPLFPFGKRVYRNPPKIRLAKDQPENIDHLILLVHGAGEYRSQKEKTQSTSRPRVVRRGHDESEIEDTEPSSIDHILLLCHGVGSACDMRFRNVEEVVDDFRATSLQLVQSHYRNSYENGVVSRVEVLPISWHSTLHSGENGVDRRLAQITLDSIPRLRNFTNDTVLDVLFYTSPVYCQTIIDTVCNELNRIYNLFLQRNPGFTGGVSLGGHSLGSVILYDLLCHQESESKEGSAEKSFVNKTAGGCTNQPSLNYPKLIFNPAALYALGSPIAIFECIRGVESLGMEFALPTCKNFFNIFHPYDPIAYRIEPLINPQLRNVKPFLVPHHKGRKRMHLELKDTMVRVGADLKQKFMESIRTTWNKWKAQTPTDGQLEKVVEEEMEKEQLNEERKEESAQNETASPDTLGKLNGGRRVDYVLQEAPLEVINEYLFAMSSHVGYWESEDTMLLMLREIYDALGVQPDSTIPQQNMTVQRTRALMQDETIVIDQPTTSRGSL